MCSGNRWIDRRNAARSVRQVHVPRVCSVALDATNHYGFDHYTSAYQGAFSSSTLHGIC
jgi:hypothetical protein